MPDKTEIKPTFCDCMLCKEITKKVRNRNKAENKSKQFKDNRIWRIFPGEWCPKCDTPVAVFTAPLLPNGFAYDKDPIQCPHCNKKGHFSIGVRSQFFPARVRNVIIWEDE